MNDRRKDTVWSAEQLQAASVVAPTTPIDWTSIRQNKQKYEELKWKGESVSQSVVSVYCSALIRLTFLDQEVNLIDFFLVKRL